MEFYSFSKENGKKIAHFNSDFIMSRIIQTDKTTQIGCMHLEKNGIVGYHQAVTPQLMLVLNGEGYVRNEIEEYYKVQAGNAIFWGKGEWHETKTDKGLTAIVIESESLEPSSFIHLKK